MSEVEQPLCPRMETQIVKILHVFEETCNLAEGRPDLVKEAINAKNNDRNRKRERPRQERIVKPSMRDKIVAACDANPLLSDAEIAKQLGTRRDYVHHVLSQPRRKP